MKTLEQRTRLQKSESVAIKNVLDGKEEITLSDSTMAKDSAMNEKAVSGRLLVKEIEEFRIIKRKPRRQ